MRFSRRYIGLVLLPPIAILLPAAISFLVHVTRITRWMPMALTAIVVYVAGAALFLLAVGPYARRAEEAIAGAANEGRHPGSVGPSPGAARHPLPVARGERSEEHTSELQSLA